MKQTLSAILFFLLSILPSHSQKPNYFKKLFIDAEYYLLFREYNEALPLYLEIFGYQPDNMNVAYRIGECYLHIPNEKQKALIYLENASTKISKEYKSGELSEQNAPIEVHYLLGIGYRMNNQLDLAIKSLDQYIELLDAGEMDKKQQAELEIETCNNAKELMQKPVNFKETNLGSFINTSFSNIKPVVSANDSTLIYVSQLRFYDGIFGSDWEDGKWNLSANLTPFLGTDGDINTCSMSFDGKTLYFNRYDWDNYNLYYSRLKNQVWGKVDKLDRKINSKYNETHACPTVDGKTLYFTSDRPEGFGGKDIYTISLNSEGEWGEPVILGPEINTPFDEETPFITKEGRLYFSSRGHKTMGGFDIFFSQMVDSLWTKPVNIGYPINTTDDDLHFMPLQNGKVAYYSMFRPDGFGGMDIYRIEFTDE